MRPSIFTLYVPVNAKAFGLMRQSALSRLPEKNKLGVSSAEGKSKYMVVDLFYGEIKYVNHSPDEHDKSILTTDDVGLFDKYLFGIPCRMCQVSQIIPVSAATFGVIAAAFGVIGATFSTL